MSWKNHIETRQTFRERGIAMVKKDENEEFDKMFDAYIEEQKKRGNLSDDEFGPTYSDPSPEYKERIIRGFLNLEPVKPQPKPNIGVIVKGRKATRKAIMVWDDRRPSRSPLGQPVAPDPKTSRMALASWDGRFLEIFGPPEGSKNEWQFVNLGLFRNMQGCGISFPLHECGMLPFLLRETILSVHRDENIWPAIRDVLPISCSRLSWTDSIEPPPDAASFEYPFVFDVRGLALIKPDIRAGVLKATMAETVYRLSDVMEKLRLPVSEELRDQMRQKTLRLRFDKS
jgi:hypothetical protein